MSYSKLSRFWLFECFCRKPLIIFGFFWSKYSFQFSPFQRQTFQILFRFTFHFQIVFWHKAWLGTFDVVVGKQLQDGTNGISVKWFSSENLVAFARAVQGLMYSWTGCWVIGQTLLMQWLEVIIARLDHNRDNRWSNWPDCSPIHLCLIKQSR